MFTLSLSLSLLIHDSFIKNILLYVYMFFFLCFFNIYIFIYDMYRLVVSERERRRERELNKNVENI